MRQGPNFLADKTNVGSIPIGLVRLDPILPSPPWTRFGLISVPDPTAEYEMPTQKLEEICQKTVRKHRLSQRRLLLPQRKQRRPSTASAAGSLGLRFTSGFPVTRHPQPRHWLPLHLYDLLCLFRTCLLDPPAQFFILKSNSSFRYTWVLVDAGVQIGAGIVDGYQRLV